MKCRKRLCDDYARNALIQGFRIAWWTSAGTELTFWLFAFPGLVYAVLIVCVPCLYGVWGRMWNLIVSVPEQCIFVYFSCVCTYTAVVNVTPLRLLAYLLAE